MNNQRIQVKQPKKHTGVRFLLLVVIGLICAAALRADDPIYEALSDLREGGRRSFGIVLRTLPGSYLVAMEDQVRLFPRDQVQRTGRTPQEIIAIEALLNSIESGIRNSRFLNARADLPKLQQAIADFDAMVEPKVRASSSSDAFRDAVRNAQAFFTQQYNSVEPTIQALELSRSIQQIAAEIDQNRKAFSNELLLELASDLNKLSSIKEEIPLAARERTHAIEAMEQRIDQCINALRQNAVNRFKANWDAGLAKELLGTLKTCLPWSNKYAEPQEPLLTELNQAAHAFAQSLPEVARDSFSFDGEVIIELEEYRRQSRRLRQINRELKDLESAVFGLNQETLRDLLAKQQTRNDEFGEQALAIRDRVHVIRSDFSNASRMFLAQDYLAAIEAFRKLDESLQGSQLKADRMREDLQRSILQAQARDLLDRLRSLDQLPADAFEALAREVQEFLARNQDKLAGIGLRSEDYQLKLDEIQGYIRFRNRLTVLREQFTEQPKTTWTRITALDESLKDRANRFPVRAEREWTEFLTAFQGKAYQQVVKVFEDNGMDWSEPTDEKTWASVIEYALGSGRETDAITLLIQTINQIDRDHTDPFANTLINLTMQASRAMTRIGDHGAATRAYDQLRERFPEYARTRVFQELLVELLLLKARTQAETGEAAEALDAYQRICDEFPDFVTDEVFNAFFNLSLQVNEKLQQDTEAWHEYLDGYAKTFGNRVRSTDAVVQTGTTIVDQFKSHWESGTWSEASKELLSVHNRYPHLLAQSQAVDQVMSYVNQDLTPLLEKENQLAPGEIMDSLTLLAARDFRRPVQRHKIDRILVSFKMRQADRLLGISQVGSVERAYDIFREIQWRFPELSREFGIDQRMREFIWERRMDMFRKPMRIYDRQDWVALLAWILFWIAYFLRSVRVGRRFGHLHYSLWHFLTVFLSFIILLAVFLVGAQGHFSHLLAAFLAWMIPAALFSFIGLGNGLGLLPYVFFPLIYARRRLNLYRLSVRVGKRLPGIQNSITPLVDRMERLETDLPLLHDRWLFRISRNARLAETDPEAAFNGFQVLLKKLEKEVFKDESWRENRINCLFNLGQLAWVLKREEEALDYLNQHLQEEPRSTDTRELLADIYYQTARYEEAIPHLKACLATQNDNDALWFNLGRCFFETGKYKSAFKCFETMRETDRDALFYGARAFARANLHQRSIEWYQRLLKNNAQDGEAIYYLASSFAHQSEDVKAFKIIDLIKEDNPFYPQALALQGALLLRNRKTEKAREYFDASLERNASLPAALLGRGQIALESGDAQRAEPYFSNLLLKDPDHAAANYYYGVLLAKREPAKAIDHFMKAIDQDAFRRQSANHIGRIHFFSAEYSKSIECFKIAEEAGERSPWFLYLFAYALACEGQLHACEQVLIKILGHASTDPEWRKKSARAMYSIGQRLFEHRDYHMAGQCFEYVKQNLDDSRFDKPLDGLLEETNFRTVVEFIRRGDYLGARTLVAELQLATQDTTRYASYQYYTALCHLYQEDYDNAFVILNDLASNHPEPRYRYHLAIAELGRNKREQAMALVKELSASSELPNHIRIGIKTMDAYLLARDGDSQNAEQTLAAIQELSGTFPGAEYVRQKVQISRAFYLCQIQDSTRLQFLMGEMKPECQSKAAYLQALSCLEGGHLSAAINNLRPFADQSDANIRLYTSLGTDLANMAIRDGNLKRATEILEGIPKPPSTVVGALEALNIAEILRAAEDVEGISKAVLILRGSLIKAKDRLLRHSIVHNLGILTLRLGILVEDTRDKTNVEECWQNFWNFWEQNMFQNKDYWSRAIERLTENPKTAQALSEDELGALDAEFREQVLMRIFIGFVVAYITEPNGQSDLIRHLNYLNTIGQQDGKLVSYMKRLGHDAKDYVENIDKSDPILKTWDFVINYMRVQVAVAEALQSTDTATLQEQLDTYIEFRNHYASPSDFMQAKKVFNTELLDALQQGMNGKFSSVGDKLDEILSNVPHGIDISPVADLLWQMRQYCRKPSRAAERGVNLVHEFERVYQRVVNFTMQKGK